MDPFVKSIIREIRTLPCDDTSLVEVVVAEIEKRGKDPNDTVLWRARHDREALISEYRDQLAGIGGDETEINVHFIPANMDRGVSGVSDRLLSWQKSGPRQLTHQKFQPNETATGNEYKTEVQLADGPGSGTPIPVSGRNWSLHSDPSPATNEPMDRISTARMREKNALRKTHRRFVDRSDMGEQFSSLSDQSDTIRLSGFDRGHIDRRDYERHMMQDPPAVSATRRIGRPHW